jgi:hypothetical protein
LRIYIYIYIYNGRKRIIFLEENMRKVILCLLFAIAMVFGFIGCKNDAQSGAGGTEEPEWHEGN